MSSFQEKSKGRKRGREGGIKENQREFLNKEGKNFKVKVGSPDEGKHPEK